MKFSRRTAIEVLGAGALAPAAAIPMSAAQVPAPPKEGKDTPKIAVGMGDGGGVGRGATSLERSAAGRRVKQIGVDHVLSGGPGALPWTEQGLTTLMEPWKAAGVQVSNRMINVSLDIIYGKTGNKHDEDIANVQELNLPASKISLPLIVQHFCE